MQNKKNIFKKTKTFCGNRIAKSFSFLKNKGRIARVYWFKLRKLDLFGYSQVISILLLIVFFCFSLYCLGFKPLCFFGLFFGFLLISKLRNFEQYTFIESRRDLIDRLFILSIIFTPLMIVEYLFLITLSSEDKKFWISCVPHFFGAWWFQWVAPIGYFTFVGRVAYFIEANVDRKGIISAIQSLTRFAPAVVATILFLMFTLCCGLVYYQAIRKPDFTMYEFGSQGKLETLCAQVNSIYGYNIISSPTLENLNKLLCAPGLYERVQKEKKEKSDFAFSENVKYLAKERLRYLPRDTDDENGAILCKKLNRLILEEVYPKYTPKKLRTTCFIKNTAWLFYMMFLWSCPLFCLIPIIVIISKPTKTERTNQAIDIPKLFNKFYKIFFIETPVTISCGCFFLMLGIGFTCSSPAISRETDITMWQLGFELSKLFTPIILLVTPLSVAIRDFDRLFVSDYHKRVCSIIATMRGHKIILGYGYLGREVLTELKERRIVDHRNVLDIITPKLQKRKFYKDLLIVDKDRNVFNYVFDDPIYGTIGIIESAIAQLSEGQQKIGKDTTIEPTPLIIGIVGDHGMATLERANVKEASLFISAIPDYEATNTLIKVLSDKKYTCSCIVTIQDDHQFKLQLPYIYNEVADSKSLILLYPSYLEGVELGRLVLLAAKKWQQRKSSEETLPDILVCGSGKQIYYIIQTYLLGLQQLSNKSIENSNIRILSDERFYVDTIKDKGNNFNQTDIESGVLNENFALPNITKEFLKHKIYISDPRDKKNIDTILLSNIRPDIIVISHKIAWDVLRILRSWCDLLSQKNDYKPLILVGNKGEDARLAECLKNYAKGATCDTSFPIQDHDADSGIYRDARGLIASMAESLTSNHDSNDGLPKDTNSLSLHFYVSTHDNPLSYLCNKLSGLINVSSVESTSWKLTFTNTRVYNCPGSLDLRKDRNNRFIIETDVVIKKTVESKGKPDVVTNEPAESERKPDENVICKGLIMPKCRKQTVEGLLRIEKERKCFNEYCDLRELCDDSINFHIPKSDGSEITAIARIKVCSDLYDTPGSVARSLNSLKLYKTEVNTDFFEDKFELKPADVKNLCERIEKDCYSIDINYFAGVNPNTCQWLNKFLTIPAFYDKLINKNPNMSLSDEINKLIEETDNYRQKNYCDLNDNQKYSIKKFNRLLLKIKYPNETPEICRAVINLTGIRSYYCPDPSTSRIELYGNKTRIKYDKWQLDSNISHVSICPVTNKDTWIKYGNALLSFLNKNTSSEQSGDKLSYTLESNDVNYIKITKCTHKPKCPGTCSMAKREKYKNGNWCS